MEAMQLDTAQPRPKVVPIRNGNVLRAAHLQARAGRLSTATELYETHLRQQPNDLPAWMALGALLRHGGDFERALICQQRALRLNDQSAAVWSNLGSLWSDLEQHQQARRCHHQALRLAPQALAMKLAQARSLREASCFDEALEAVDACLVLGPGRAELEVLRAEILLYLGRRLEGLQAFESRLLMESGADLYAGIPRWQGQRLDGRRILVRAERGLGMTLLAARYLRSLVVRGAEVSFLCDQVLHPVMQAVPASLLTEDTHREAPGDYDYYSPLLSLVRLLEPQGRRVPDPLGITLPTCRTAQYQALCGNAADLKLGVVWSSALQPVENRKRGFEFERLHRLAHLPGVQLVSLQRDLPARQLPASNWGRRVVDLNLMLHDFGETAAAISAIDIILTCDSAVAHLGASMNKPVVLLLNYRPDWIYGLSADWTPWYPSMHLIRQPEPGDWDSAMREVNKLIGTMARSRLNQRARQGLL